MRHFLRITFFLIALPIGCSSTAKAPTAQDSPTVAPKAESKLDQDDSLHTVSDTLNTAMGELQIAPIWHGTIAFKIAGKVILVDPWSKAPDGRMPKADLILITDIHQDHLDPDAIRSVQKEGTIIIGPQAVADMLPGVIVLGNDQDIEKLGVGIRGIPMYNLKRGPEEGKLFHDKGRGNGYVLSFGDTKVYISGDTACTPEMKALKDIDLAFVCMNLPYTMPPVEAAECINAFAPTILIPFHYRGSNLGELENAITNDSVELRQRDFYAP